jgi:hypothetical protein
MVEILSIDQMIEKFVLEAIFNKEIVRSSATRDISNVLLTVLYGSIIVAHTKQQSPVKLFFRKNLDMVLKSVTDQLFILTVLVRFFFLSFFLLNHQWWYLGFTTVVVPPEDF